MTTTTENHAEQQAKAQLESIVEMVEALDEESARRTAATEYAKDLSRERCTELLNEVSIEAYDDEPIDELREAVIENITDETITPEDFEFEFDEDEARETIQEDPLSIQVRSGWYTPGDRQRDDASPEEFEILLCTGGPAVRIVGELDSGQPDRPRLQYQDWGTPWTEYFIEDNAQREALLTYCQQFYFGE